MMSKVEIGKKFEQRAKILLEKMEKEKKIKKIEETLATYWILK